jgi:hypothetical protein
MQTAEEVEDVAPVERNITPAKVPVAAGLFAPVDAPAVSPLNELSARLNAANISFPDATEYLRSQLVTEAEEFDLISDDEARLAIAGFSYLEKALTPIPAE